MANHFSILALRTPWTSMKRQKDRTLKDGLPRSVGAQYATGDQWRNNSRKNEETAKAKQHPVVDVTGDRSQVQCCKEQYRIGTWNVRSTNQGKLEMVKQEMTRVNVDILGLSKLKWTGMGEFNSDAVKLKTLAPWKKSYDQLRQHIIKQRHYFASKGPSSQSYGFSSSRGWMWELDYKESWAPKNCFVFWTVVLEKTVDSPLDVKEIQPVHPKGNQSWIFIGRADAEAETLILWSPDAKTYMERPWGWETLKAVGEGGNRGWDGWMASLTQWTRVWVNSGSWWWTGRSGVLQSMGLQRVGHDWATELNW